MKQSWGVVVIAVIICLVLVYGNYIDMQRVEAAGSHSTHQVKIFWSMTSSGLEEAVNSWIDDHNSNPDFNIINIDLEGDSRSNRVLVWYEE